MRSKSKTAVASDRCSSVDVCRYVSTLADLVNMMDFTRESARIQQANHYRKILDAIVDCLETGEGSTASTSECDKALLNLHSIVKC